MSDSTHLLELERHRNLVRPQLPHVRKMLMDEAWHKGTRVHHFVPLDDPEINQIVADIILSQWSDILTG
jgi:hypothetical protein